MCVCVCVCVCVCRYDAKCDVWSLGCILWDMANSSNRFIHVRVHTTLYQLGLQIVPLSLGKHVHEVVELCLCVCQSVLSWSAEDYMHLTISVYVCVCDQVLFTEIGHSLSVINFLNQFLA